MNYETAALELGADREAHRIALWLWRSGLPDGGAPEVEQPGRLAAAKYLATKLGLSSLEELEDGVRRLNSADDDDDVGNPADLAPLTHLILAKECVERGLITTPEQYIRAVEGPKR